MINHHLPVNQSKKLSEMVRSNYHLTFAKTLASLLDNKFKFLGVRFGLDPILNIIPGLGDLLGVLLSLYFIFIAIKLNLPGNLIAKMWWNIFVDFLFGLIPVVGVIGDIFYKANIRNLKILEDYLSAK